MTTIQRAFRDNIQGIRLNSADLQLGSKRFILKRENVVELPELQTGAFILEAGYELPIKSIFRIGEVTFVAVKFRRNVFICPVTLIVQKIV